MGSRQIHRHSATKWSTVGFDEGSGIVLKMLSVAVFQLLCSMIHKMKIVVFQPKITSDMTFLLKKNFPCDVFCREVFCRIVRQVNLSSVSTRHHFLFLKLIIDVHLLYIYACLYACFTTSSILKFEKMYWTLFQLMRSYKK